MPQSSPKSPGSHKPVSQNRLKRPSLCQRFGVTNPLAYDLAVPDASEDGLKRQPPDVTTLLGLLSEAGVNYVVTGSAAAMLHGVPLVPGDLDITPALDADNLTRLAAVLASIEAHQDPSAPFGHWERGDDGEQHWVETAPTPEAVVARANWRPDPAEPASFDHLLQSRHGALDVVPEVSGTYDELMPRAVALDIEGNHVWVESVEDILATLTVPRRAKDRDRVGQLRVIQRSGAVATRPSA